MIVEKLFGKLWLEWFNKSFDKNWTSSRLAGYVFRQKGKK